ncbi:MAG: hypothetical protein HKN42_18945 [Granulosicoccus sp.]|nr:hypothetical protein [Granulosicoccus sp.]
MAVDFIASEAMMIPHQQGQVLPLGIALLAVGMLGALVLFNTGQVATDKMKLANTADAAAYSGTLWQARALNFQSYTNRAMVANQVSIAQAVSLQSWVTYGAVASENIATVLKPVPIINAVADGLQRGLDVVEEIMSPVAKALVTLVDIVNRGLSLSQQAMFVSTFVATPDVIRSVVAETDARFSVNTGFSGLGLADNLNQWRQFTQAHAADDPDAMDERMSMINDSRDAFTRQRNWKFFNFWFYSTPLLRHQLRREGETRLIRVDTPAGMQWEWKAKDTLSLHNRLWHWRGTKRYEVPIGWAEAFANSENDNHTIEPDACTTAAQMRSPGCSRFLGINRRSEYLADIGQPSVLGKQTRIAMRHYTGVQAYRSLSQASIAEDRPHLTLKVEVSLPVEKISNSHALGSHRQFAAPLSAPGERISSISVAEVFYKRPDAQLAGHPGRTLELANGYNPYWDSRLSSVSEEDRLLAFAMRDSTGSGRVPNNGADGLPARADALQDYTESTESTASYSADEGDGVSSNRQQPDALLPRGPSRDFESVAGALDTNRLESFRRDIEEQLTDALRNQVKDMLAGALSGSMGGHAQSVDELEDDLQHMAEARLGELASSETAQSFDAVVQEATDLAAALEDEFKAIRQTIVQTFQVSFEESRRVFEEETEALRGSIQAHRLRLDDRHLNEEARAEVERVINRFELELADRRDAFERDLALQLMQIVNDASSLYVMRLKEAAYLVGEFLRSEETELRLPWLEFLEEDDTDE